MRKNLTSSGNGWELYLNSPIMKLIGISPNQRKVTLVIKKDVLIVQKYNENNTEANNDIFVKNLSKRGGGYALFLPLPILELLNITSPETDFLDIEIDENKLSVT